MSSASRDIGTSNSFAFGARVKVPEVTVFFWIIKVLSTGMGETTSDFFVHRFDPIIPVSIAGLGLVGILVVQMRVRRYIVWIYWLAVVMVSVFGTMAADVLHVVLGVPYSVSTLFFALALAGVFSVWYGSEQSLSIHSIDTKRREMFYWAAVLTTFALGTAVGDLTATTMGLGYFASGALFVLVIFVPAIGFWRLGFNAIMAFWFAYIVTRPLGASFADWMGVSHIRGGLAWGTGPVSLTMGVMIAGLVAYISIRDRNLVSVPSA